MNSVSIHIHGVVSWRIISTTCHHRLGNEREVREGARNSVCVGVGVGGVGRGGENIILL